jgi:hypothetical protein
VTGLHAHTRWAAASLFVVAVLPLPVALAAAGEADIHWVAPPGCPEEPAIRAAVRRWLQQSPEPLDAQAVRVEATIERVAGGFALELELESPSGTSQERLRAERCAAFIDVVGLKVSQAASPLGWHEAPRDAEERAPERSPRVPRPSAAVPVGFAFGVRAALGGDVGALSSSAGATAWLRIAAFRFGVGLVYDLPFERRYPRLPQAGVELRRFAGSAQACIAPLLRPVELPLCAGFELGVMRGTGFGVSAATTSDQLWSALELGPALRASLYGPLSAWVELQTLALLTRPGYHVRNLERLYRSDRFSVRGLLGIELSLW